MREHIEFIQTQHLPWEDAASLGWSGGRVKLLSRDDVDGSFSCVLSLPGGFARKSGARDVDEEFFTLDGELTIDGAQFGENVYAFRAAGGPGGAVHARATSTMLYFRSAAVAAGLRAPDVAARRDVRRIALAEIDWDGDFARLGLGALASGARMQILREDPFSGEATYVSASIAYRRGLRAERHPISQEFYMLAGELAGEYGVMRAGAYCIRPPMFRHAPYVSTAGAVILFRGLGGRQETFWEDAEPAPLDPAHRPILPDRLRPFGAPFARAPRY